MLEVLIFLFIVLKFHFGFLARDFRMALEASQTEEYWNRAAQFEMEPGAPIEEILRTSKCFLRF